MSFETRRGLLRALAHPVRLELLDALREEPGLTATRAAALVGVSPSNCSFHLRVLAEHGLVEEANGGRGRERPWRRTCRGLEIRTPDLESESQTEAGDFMRLVSERDNDQLHEWLQKSAEYPAEWLDAASHISVTTRLTPDELAAVGHELTKVIRRLVDFSEDSTPRPGTLPVRLFVHTFPNPRPGDGDRSDGPGVLPSEPLS